MITATFVKEPKGGNEAGVPKGIGKHNVMYTYNEILLAIKK
jgi:hypothetical protein